MSENRAKNLAKNTLIITIGNVCTKLITFFLLPLYTSVLSTSEYGTVDLLNTLVSLLLPVITFQIENATFRELIETRESNEKTNNIISNSIIFVFLQCIVFTVFFMIVSPLVKNNYKIFLETNVIAYIFTSLFLQIARGIGDNKKYAIGSFISAVSTVLLNVLFLVIFKLKVNGMLGATLLGQLLGGLYLFFSLKLYKCISIKKFDNSNIKKLLAYSIPLIPNALSWWIFNSSDRVIVSMFLGVSFTGILSASYKFSSAYILVYNMFHLGWAESISLHINDKDVDDFFNKIFNLVMGFFATITILVISTMPIIWKIMVNRNYDLGYGLVPILLLAAFFQTIVGMTSVVYLAKKDTKAIANTSIISAVINITTHLILIKFIGLYAAAISTLLSFGVMAIYRINDVSKKYFKIKLNYKTVFYNMAILLVILPVYYIDNLYLTIISIICTFIVFIFLNKKSFKTIIGILKKKGTK